MGKFYGIGVGPGDAELLTIKAVRILKEIDMVVCPEIKSGGGSIAFNIAKEYIRDDVEKLNLTFPMIFDEAKLNAAWDEVAETIKSELDKGKNIAFLTLGDPMVFSTYMYILERLIKQNVEVETIPGITSFCAAASKLNIPLTAGNESLCIVPLTKDTSKVDEILDRFENIVVMKASHGNKALAKKIKEKGYEDNFVLVSKCGTDSEEISSDIDKLGEDKIPYLSTVIIKKRGISHE